MKRTQKELVTVFGEPMYVTVESLRVNYRVTFPFGWSVTFDKNKLVSYSYKLAAIYAARKIENRPEALKDINPKSSEVLKWMQKKGL